MLSRAPSPGWAERSLRFDEGRKAPEIRLSKLRIEKREQVTAVHGATLRVPFRDFPAVGFVRARKVLRYYFLVAFPQTPVLARGHPDRRGIGGRDDSQPTLPGRLCSNLSLTGHTPSGQPGMAEQFRLKPECRSLRSLFFIKNK